MARIDIDVTGEYATYGDVKIVMSVEQLDDLAEILADVTDSSTVAELLLAYSRTKKD